MSRSHILYIIIGGLLLALPFVMQGQTIKRYESQGWYEALTQGTVIRPYVLDPYWPEEGLSMNECRVPGLGQKRISRRYMTFDEGVGNIVNFDYVNGFSFGPDVTFGFVGENNSRLELATELRYGLRRHKWSKDIELRYIFPPIYYSWVSIFGKHKTVDFDNYAYTSYRTNTIGSGLAGWNGFKLYDARQLGVKGSAAVANDLQLTGGVWHEKRWQMENHRKRNIFRVRGEDNLPRLRSVALDDARLHWDKQSLWRVDAALEYTPNRRIMCYNDLRTEPLPGNPVFRLGVQSGWGDVDYLALDLSVKQTIGNERQGFRFYADAGFYPVGRKDVCVMDMHHFDASHLVLQRRDNLTWFSLLSNYEMSSSEKWAEIHAEWNSCRMLFSQLVDDPALKEYVQIHYAVVEGLRNHRELSYGFDLIGKMRIGCSFGFDGSGFDGVGLNLVLFEPVLGL